jgi:hypothetical protein
MSDTSSRIDTMVRERYKQMTPDERVRIAASMFETARAIVLSSLPKGLNRRERRLAVARRLYAGELPDAALIAYAEWADPSASDGPDPR